MKKDLATGAVGILAVLMICFGLNRLHPTYPPVATHPVAVSAMTSAPSAPAPNDPVVMRVNGEPVTEKEFELYASAQPEQTPGIAMSPAGRKLLAGQIVAMKALEQEGRRLGADNDPEVTSQSAMVRVNLAANFALVKLVGNPSAAQLRAEYDKQKALMTAPTLSHILISCEGSPIPSRSGKAIPCEEALRRINQISAAVHSPQDFQRAATSVSDDTNTGANGGIIGPLRHGTLPPEVDQVVFALTPGTVSKPVRTQFGVHLFMVGAPQAETFEKVKPMLEQQWKQDRVKQVLEDVKKKAKVDYEPNFFGPDAGKPAKRPS